MPYERRNCLQQVLYEMCITACWAKRDQGEAIPDPCTTCDDPTRNNGYDSSDCEQLTGLVCLPILVPLSILYSTLGTLYCGNHSLWDELLDCITNNNAGGAYRRARYYIPTPPEQRRAAPVPQETERLQREAEQLAEQNRQAAEVIAMEREKFVREREQFEAERQRRAAAESAQNPFAKNPIMARPSTGDLSGRYAASNTSSSGVISQQPLATPSPVRMLRDKEVIFTPSFNSMLGQGGFGVVYKGRWNDINVAVKQLKDTFVDQEASKQFESEIAIMSKVQHPHIVIMYGAVTDAVPHCIVMELMTESLQKILLDSKRQLPWRQRYHYGSEVASGVGYLHSKSIIHRDLKSSNVLEDHTGKLKISDFGLAKVIKETVGYGQKAYYMGQRMGTVSHMAPELLGLEARYSYYSDAYAFGMLLWEIASRQLPYRSVADQQIIISLVKNGEREKISSDTPHVMREVIENCWTAEPSNRPMMTNIYNQMLAAIATMDSAITTQPGFADNFATGTLTAAQFADNLVTGAEKAKNKS